MMTRKAKRGPNKPKGKSDLAFTTHEFARECRISVAMLYKLWRDGKGPPYKQVGDMRIIERETGLAWLRGGS